MTKDLYRVSKDRWIVAIDGYLTFFKDVDSACDYLESAGNVPPEEVESALIEMATKSMCHSSFDPDNGELIFSDDELPSAAKEG